jgi:hypothetical protein
LKASFVMRHRCAHALASLALSWAGAAAAEAAPTAQDAACRTEEATLQQEIDAARARGRMLQRRQLADQLEAVQIRCGTLPPAQNREAVIERLKSDILELRKELDRAETELRKIRQGL